MNYSTIGTSWITEMFIESTKLTGGVKLHSVYSRSKENGDDFARKNGAESSFTDLDEMLKEPTDFIYIASPNVMHYEHIIKCIENGKHVFSEKPMVYTEEQWNEIYKQAKEKGVFVFEGYRHLFSPNYFKLKEKLAEIGPVRSGIFHYIQYSSRYDVYKGGEMPNVFSKGFAGGALMDLGVYPFSMVIDLFGEPIDIDYFPTLLSNGADSSGTLVVTYKDAIITVLTSKIAQGTIPSEIHGEDGTLTIDHIAPINSLTHFDRKTEVTKELADSQHEVDMIYQFEGFLKMIKEKDTEKHEKWLERSRLIAKWTEKARRKASILFPGEKEN